MTLKERKRLEESVRQAMKIIEKKNVSWSDQGVGNIGSGIQNSIDEATKQIIAAIQKAIPDSELHPPEHG